MAVSGHKIPETGNCYSQEIKDKKTYFVLEIAYILQINKSKAYELCKQPDFKVVRLGRTIRISKVYIAMNPNLIAALEQSPELVSMLTKALKQNTISNMADNKYPKKQVLRLQVFS